MVPRMQTDITEAEVVRQTAEYGGQVSFEAALDEAVARLSDEARAPGT